jgi:hypothetical protein
MNRTLVVLLVIAVFGVQATSAFADAADPVPSATHGTFVTNADGSRTLTVSGSWAWTTHHSDCNTDRSGVGVAIVWNDPTNPGNKVSGGGSLGDFFVGDRNDNVVHPTPGPVFQDIGKPDDFAKWRGGCGAFNGTYNTGTWGPISHIYPASVKGSVAVCPVMYDVHGKASGTEPNGEKEVTAGGDGHNGDNSIESNNNTPLGNGCFSSTFGSPHLTLAKTVSGDGGATYVESVTVRPGDTVKYHFTVTNDGDKGTDLTGVHINELNALADCDSSMHAVSPAGFNGNLAVGQTAVFECNHVMGSSSITNAATATGNQGNQPVNSNQDTAHVDVVPGNQAVLGERVTPGSARLAGPNGCVARAFNARVRGTKMATVTFRLDGKVIKRITKVGGKTLVQARINPASLKLGVHRLVVTVTFTSGSQTKTKVMRLSFQRCGKKLAAPRFTG